MAGNQSDAAFAYDEPSIATILNQAGFLLALNIVNVCLDKLLYCGLIGQVFIGILWGTPGAKWLDREMEAAIQQLGYLGVIMLVYKGGLSTSIKSLRANLPVSLAVAITGIITPICFSFILKKLVSASSLQAFAAGAALSATSLGTTFTILSTTRLINTRLGTVTTSAAMLDDVVGLVMVQIVSELGGSDASFSAMTVIRPVFVSIGFAVGLVLLCAFCLRPILTIALAMKDRYTGTIQFAFFYQTCTLVGIVAGASYAGTSSLFAAYLAGVTVSWCDRIVAELREKTKSGESGVLQSNSDLAPEQAPEASERTLHTNSQENNDSVPSSSSPAHQFVSATDHEAPTGELVYERYYEEPVNRILIPLFFASIGFAIPITEMFKRNIVWRGVVYAVLMTFSKMVTGFWLVRFSPTSFISSMKKPFNLANIFRATSRAGNRKQKQSQESTEERHQSNTQVTNDSTIPDNAVKKQDENTKAPSDKSIKSPGEQTQHQPASASTLSKPKSLYPPSILGLAMVARGEIGYLIASLAGSRGIFSDGTSQGSSEIYLVIKSDGKQ